MEPRTDPHAQPAPTGDPARLDDELREACGVFGIYAPGQSVAHLTYLGMFALQHRGQEAAGMSVSDGTELITVKDNGLVSSVFDDRVLNGLPGHLAIGHDRYSTTGASVWQNAQPVTREAAGHQIALGHNGNLVNTAELAEDLGMLPGTGAVTSDSDLVAEMVARNLERSDHDRSDDRDLEHALLEVLPKLRGAFSMVIMDEAHVVGVRDPHGFRPLCLGRLETGWVLASETPALDLIGAHFVRELEPGEMVIIDATGCRSVRAFPAEDVDPNLCLFEFVYFARPDSNLYGKNVHQARVRMGEQLAEQAPVDADMVMGVPESGVPAAEGYALRSGIPSGHGLVKNRYIGRSFIVPTQQAREAAVRMKLNPLKENLQGKRLVVVDDTIVRGTTQRTLTQMLREAGATEVHLRISAPPVMWSCFYGIDTGVRSELLAANLDLEEIRNYLEVDSIAYLSLDRLITATGTPNSGFCDACFTGDYPVDIPVSIGKGMLEDVNARSADEPIGGIAAAVARGAGAARADDAASAGQLPFEG
ncbi:MAG: amidophosphoribosyltransferase [Acidimicrobiales bacterium]|nr:amidophosphoribosyltransferase [Acidimicrobiales bacterium]